jgi:hypothetical protein
MRGGVDNASEALSPRLTMCTLLAIGLREDISSLRAQMSEFQHEMAGYRAAQMELANLAEALKLRASDWPPMATDAAPSEEISRVIVTSPPKRRGRPKKDTSQDTSQKLIDEIEQEVVEE